MQYIYNLFGWYNNYKITITNEELVDIRKKLNKTNTLNKIFYRPQEDELVNEIKNREKKNFLKSVITTRNNLKKGERIKREIKNIFLEELKKKQKKILNKID